MADSFDKNLDKITERETVFDFYERLPLGNSMIIDGTEVKNRFIYPSDFKVHNLIEGIAYALPAELADNLLELKSFKIKIPKGQRLKIDIKPPDGYFFHHDNGGGTIDGTVFIAAISSNTGLDISSAFKVNEVEPKGFFYTYEIPYPYDNDDIITIYYKITITL